MSLDKPTEKSVEDVISDLDIKEIDKYKDITDIILLALQSGRWQVEALAKLEDFIEGLKYPDSIGMPAPGPEPDEYEVDEDELAELERLKKYIEEELS